jgi:hypothetical protein
VSHSISLECRRKTELACHSARVRRKDVPAAPKSLQYRGSDVTPDTGTKQETVGTIAIGNDRRGKQQYESPMTHKKGTPRAPLQHDTQPENLSRALSQAEWECVSVTPLGRHVGSPGQR